MKIVYHCYGGAHASPTAAAIHLGILPIDSWPSFQAIQKVPYFDRITSVEHGKLIKFGEDAHGNEVYILARRRYKILVIGLIREIARLSGKDPEELLFVDCVQLFNPFMVTGGFSSRGMGWVGFGRPLVTFGTLISYPFIAQIVKRTQEKLETINRSKMGLNCK